MKKILVKCIGLIAIYCYKLKILIFIFRILCFPHMYKVYIWIILRIVKLWVLAALKLSIWLMMHGIQGLMLWYIILRHAQLLERYEDWPWELTEDCYLRTDPEKWRLLPEDWPWGLSLPEDWPWELKIATWGLIVATWGLRIDTWQLTLRTDLQGNRTYLLSIMFGSINQILL